MGSWASIAPQTASQLPDALPSMSPKLEQNLMQASSIVLGSALYPDEPKATAHPAANTAAVEARDFMATVTNAAVCKELESLRAR